MARKPTQPTDVANWDEELARMAGATTALTDSGGGGRFFSTKAGILSYDDTPLPGNQMCAIIGSWCLENVFYTEAYSADTRTPPTCFAFCKDPDGKDEMGPPDIVDSEEIFERQSDDCKTCPQNAWGSAEVGRGKACSNRRRLAMIPAGTYTKVGKTGGFELALIDDTDHFKSAEEAYLKVPVTSGKLFDNYVKQVAEELKRPLFAVYTRVFLEPNAKSQFTVNFELIESVDNALLQTLMTRHKLLTDGIDFPYTPFVDSEADKPAATTGRTQSSAKKLTGRARK